MPNLTISTAPIWGLLTACLLLLAITHGSCRDSSRRPWRGGQRRMHGGLEGHARKISPLPRHHSGDSSDDLGIPGKSSGGARKGLRQRLLRQFRLTQEAEEAVVTKCPEGCSKRGTCNEELGRCDCPRHLSGPDCSQESNNIR